MCSVAIRIDIYGRREYEAALSIAKLDNLLYRDKLFQIRPLVVKGTK